MNLGFESQPLNQHILPLIQSTLRFLGVQCKVTADAPLLVPNSQPCVQEVSNKVQRSGLWEPQLAAKRDASRRISVRTLTFGNKAQESPKAARLKIGYTHVNKQDANHSPDTEDKFRPDDAWWDSGLDCETVTWTETASSRRRARAACLCFRLCLVWKKANGKIFSNIIGPLTYILQTFGESAVTDLVIWVTQGLQSGMAGLSHALLPTMQHKRLKIRGFRTRYACVNTACSTKVSKRNKFRYRVEDSPAEKVGDEEQDAAAWQMRAVRPPSCMTIGRLFTETSCKNSW